MVKISIVVPIYNGLQYLEKLVSCLQESTFKDVEVLLIDDFSTDGSYEFLEHRINNDIKFKLIRRDKKSGNAVSAMKYILPYCKGEYFFYLSQDDFIDNDCLEKLYKKAIETNADAILPNMVWYKEGEDNEVILPPNNDYDCSLVGSDAFELSLDWKIHGFSLRKMKLLRETGFDDSYLVGDEIAVRQFYFRSQKVVFCDTNFYYRVDNVNALTRKLRPNVTDFIKGDLILLNFIKNNYSNDRVFFERYDKTLKKTYKLLRNINKNINVLTQIEKISF
ncbi:glycosyltransferase family 2 protein [Acinetobacter johnsonii]|uniref:glycosyltransferase family 2 protein n=1 Tax=Acinetobacter johnsonii TaxID=40214 RepID=UPI003D164065